MKLESLFPVQKQVIPFVLNETKSQSIYPNDLCILAPTGSGKTLTYVLPLISNLKNRIRPCCRAIVLLPVSDLAEQVYQVFKEQLSSDFNNLSLLGNERNGDAISNKNNLRVILLSNKHPFSKEQAQLVNEHGKCVNDIVVATPGRLVDHIQKTDRFCLNELRYLILDECDRIMDQIKQNWLPILIQAVYANSSRQQLNQEHLNVHNMILNKAHARPMQKVLTSATLTRDPEKLEQIGLFQALYFNVGAESLHVNMQQMQIDEHQINEKEKQQHESQSGPTNQAKEEKVRAKELTAKLNLNSSDINVPNELKEFFIQVVAQQKPMMLIYLIKTLGYRHTLCFVKTKESAQRLNMLLELNGIKSCEYSSTLHAARRKRVQSKFEENKLDVLVCSDVMARGMDLKNVDYVILYDAPNHLGSYIHRVGRTARAGRSGTAITLLEQKEVYFFKKMTKSINSSTNLNENNTEKVEEKSQHKIKEIKVPRSKLKHLVDEFRSSLGKLKESLRKSNKSNNKSDQKQQQNGSKIDKRDWKIKKNKKDEKEAQPSEEPAIKSKTKFHETIGE